MKRLRIIILKFRKVKQFYIKLVDTSVFKPLNRVVYLGIFKTCMAKCVKAIEG